MNGHTVGGSEPVVGRPWKKTDEPRSNALQRITDSKLTLSNIDLVLKKLISACKQFSNHAVDDCFLCS